MTRLLPNVEINNFDVCFSSELFSILVKSISIRYIVDIYSNLIPDLIAPLTKVVKQTRLLHLLEGLFCAMEMANTVEIVYPE